MSTTTATKTSPAKPKAAKTPKPHGPQGPAYTNRVVCAKRGCKEVRWCKPQDAFQVRYCVEHQAEATKAKRSANAKVKREALKAAAPASPTRATKPKTAKAKTPAKHGTSVVQRAVAAAEAVAV